jgi:hypothetical protein
VGRVGERHAGGIRRRRPAISRTMRPETTDSMTTSRLARLVSGSVSQAKNEVDTKRHQDLASPFGGKATCLIAVGLSEVGVVALFASAALGWRFEAASGVVVFEERGGRVVVIPWPSSFAARFCFRVRSIQQAVAAEQATTLFLVPFSATNGTREG